jgi:hypothetical protein
MLYVRRVDHATYVCHVHLLGLIDRVCVRARPVESMSGWRIEKIDPLRKGSVRREPADGKHVATRLVNQPEVVPDWVTLSTLD